jgi:signal peptidase I
MTSLAPIARRAGALALVLVGVWLFLPTGLGGATTYVSTHGTSMQPGFTAGDLAVLRPSSGYQVGDIVAYQSDSLDTTVMHRIVERDGDRFVLQGDNNDWLDGDRPAEGDILGELWFRIPQGGKAIATLRSPAVLAMIGLASVTALLVVRRPGRSRRRASSSRSVRSFSLPARARARQALLASGSIALLAGAGTAVLVVLPATQTDARAVEVDQHGEFSYAGAAALGTTYPTGRIVTGDPIYPALTRGLTVSFTQSVTAAEPASLTGGLRLDVSVGTPDGWTAVVARGSAAPVFLDGTTATVDLVPADAMAVLDRHAREVGTPPGVGGTVTVTPVLDATGSVAGQPFTAAAMPALSFTFDATTLRPAAGAEALHPTSSTSVAVTEVGPRTLSALGVSVSVRIARLAVGGVLALALLVAAGATWIGAAGGSGAADDLLLRDAGRILRVSAFTPTGSVVDLADAEALHRVAVRLDTLVLYVAEPLADTFAVQDGDTTYRYVVPRAAVPTADAAPALITRFA